MTCQRDGCWGECPTHQPTYTTHIGNLSWDALEGAYLEAKWGGIEPNMIVVSPSTMAKLKAWSMAYMKIAPDPPPTTFYGLSYNGATVVTDKYAPDGQFTFCGKVNVEK